MKKPRRSMITGIGKIVQSLFGLCNMLRSATALSETHALAWVAPLDSSRARITPSGTHTATPPSQKTGAKAAVRRTNPVKNFGPSGSVERRRRFTKNDIHTEIEKRLIVAWRSLTLFDCRCRNNRTISRLNVISSKSRSRSETIFLLPSTPIYDYID